MTGLWLGLTLSVASAAEYRTVELVDGRLVVAELLVVDEREVRVQVPQGVTAWSLSAIQSLEPATREDYDSQPDLTVLVLPVETQIPESGAPLAEQALGRVTTLLPRIPGLAMWDYEGLHARVGESSQAGLEDCGSDPECVLGVLGPRVPLGASGRPLEGPLERPGAPWGPALGRWPYFPIHPVWDAIRLDVVVSASMEE